MEEKELTGQEELVSGGELGDLPKEKESNRRKLTDLDVAKKMLNLKQSADSRDIKFDLSFVTLKKLMEQKKCFYTGRTLDSKGDYALSIDRIDNKLGYVEGNVVSCTVEINRKKTDITLDEIEMIYKAIKKTKKGIFGADENGDNQE
jgi:hypothetical protein